MIQRKEGEVDEIERGVQELKLESYVNDSMQPFQGERVNQDRTIDELVKATDSPTQTKPLEEKKAPADYSVQWNNADA